ncbi:hypothetical protein ABZT43_26085 [Streptomyces sp. NPDC005349]|uniref:hypothetical protein n=1 Tax=Streptomyces sp. NPDC005349 TaxID=3157037 RepID=UPI0033B97D81
MTQPKVSAIEGTGHVPTLPLLQRLAKALDVHLTIDLDEANPIHLPAVRRTEHATERLALKGSGQLPRVLPP